MSTKNAACAVLHYLARDGGIPTDLRQPFPGEGNDVIGPSNIGMSDVVLEFVVSMREECED